MITITIHYHQSKTLEKKGDNSVILTFNINPVPIAGDTGFL